MTAVPKMRELSNSVAVVGADESDEIGTLPGKSMLSLHLEAVTNAVRDAGLEVPDDVALVCFDDIEYASRMYPFLTVMAQPAETLGSLGTQLLLERIDGRARDRGRSVVLAPQFVVRRSCGAMAA
jgi:DNA-binding LacI/PurR family transcriptional regulator